MSEKIQVLIYEKDKSLGHLLQEFLQMKGYETNLFDNIKEAKQAVHKTSYLLAIIDIDEDKPDELEMGREMKVIREDMAIIYMASVSDKKLVIEAFHAGADDFIRKPFIMEEVYARVHIILWRIRGEKVKTTVYYQIGKFFFDALKQTLTLDNVVTPVTTKECILLTLLCQHANKVLDRSFALRIIWKEDTCFSARSMDVYITKLRKLLKADPELSIVNIHGHGYQLVTRSSKM